MEPLYWTGFEQIVDIAYSITVKNPSHSAEDIDDIPDSIANNDNQVSDNDFDSQYFPNLVADAELDDLVVSTDNDGELEI